MVVCKSFIKSLVYWNKLTLKILIRRVKDLITESIATLGENISINRFTRFAIGE